MSLEGTAAVSKKMRGWAKLICWLLALRVVVDATAGVPVDRKSQLKDVLGRTDTVTRASSAILPSTNADAMQRLGARLFFDRRLSADGTVSCASCHVPERAFQDNKPVAIGIGGAAGVRNTPSLINVAMVPNLFWDGRRDTLEEQARDPFIHPREHGLIDERHLVRLVSNDPKYEEVFGREEPSNLAASVYAALAQFERGLISRNSPFDRFWQAGDVDSMTQSAQRGFDLFKGRAGCITCHSFDERHFDLTDNSFHAIGLGLIDGGAQLPDLIRLVLNAPKHSAGELLSGNQALAALGRFIVSKDPADIGAYRTPSLRNVAETAPYMHDGSVPTLEAAIDREVYYRGQRDGQPLVLTLVERDDLVAFLRELTTSDSAQLAQQAYRAAGLTYRDGSNFRKDNLNDELGP